MPPFTPGWGRQPQPRHARTFTVGCVSCSLGMRTEAPSAVDRRGAVIAAPHFASARPMCGTSPNTRGFRHLPGSGSPAGKSSTSRAGTAPIGCTFRTLRRRRTCTQRRRTTRDCGGSFSGQSCGPRRACSRRPVRRMLEPKVLQVPHAHLDRVRMKPVVARELEQPAAGAQAVRADDNEAVIVIRLRRVLAESGVHAASVSAHMRRTKPANSRSSSSRSVAYLGRTSRLMTSSATGRAAS